jgi:hypothetical protein
VRGGISIPQAKERDKDKGRLSKKSNQLTFFQDILLFVYKIYYL